MLRPRLLLTLAAAVAIIVVAGGAFWYFILRDDAPPEVSLESAVGSLATKTPAAGTAATSTTGGGTPAATTSSSSTAPGINGTWTPDTSQQTFLGYRVNEELARVGFQTAVGRTTGVTGTVVVENNTVTSATIDADMTKLKSDSNMRDGQLRNQGIEYSKYPRATFVLGDRVTIPANLTEGQQFETTLNGKLTLHGVTKDVSIPVKAQLQSGLLVVVGSTNIVFADYQIGKPNGASVLSIEDHGVLELQLFLKKS